MLQKGAMRMTKTLIGTPDAEGDVRDWEQWEAEMEEGDWQSETVDLAEDASSSEGDWLNDPYSGLYARADSIDPFPEPSVLDHHPLFIVTIEDDTCEDEDHWEYAVRGRGTDFCYGEGDYPTYNEPLLYGTKLWCELAAKALNEVTVP